MAALNRRRRQGGVSLLEVLMAVLIFSIGLIGLGGLLIVATRSNQSAFVRTQVTFLANSMADRMRANPYGLWNGDYNFTLPLAAGTLPTCDATAACGPTSVATRDKMVWAAQLQAFLPGLGTTSVNCVKDSAAYDPAGQINKRPPYGGLCTMIITWAERGYGANDNNTDSAALQSFTWVFEP